MINGIPEVSKQAEKKWVVEGFEDRTFRTKTQAEAFAQENPVGKPLVEVLDEQPEPQAETRYDVLMTNGTPVLGNAPVDAVAWFLAQRLAQSAVTKPLRTFKIQPLVLKEDPEHDQDWADAPVAAADFAEKFVTKDLIDEARKELASASGSASDRKKVLRSLTAPKVSAGKQARTPAIGERFADEQLVAGSGGKVTYGMVRRIRSETALYFEAGAPRGKVETYKRLAKELNLGLETIAKISRRNIFADVE